MESSTFNWKEFASALVAVILNIIAFWFWRDEIANIFGVSSEAYKNFIIPGVALLSAAVSFGIAALFTNNKWLNYGTAIVSTGAPYLFLKPTGIVYGALFVSIAFGLLSVRRIQKDYSFSTSFSGAKTLRDGLPLYFTSIAIILAVMYLQVKNHDFSELSVPRPIINYTLNTIAKNKTLSETFGLPQLNPDATVDEVVLQFVGKGLSQQGIALKSVPQAELAKLLRDQRSAFAEQYGLTLTGKEKISNVFSAAISKLMERILGPYKQYLPYVLAIAFFFAFKTISVILYYIALIFIVLIVKLFLAIGILNRKTKNVELEKLSF